MDFVVDFVANFDCSDLNYPKYKAHPMKAVGKMATMLVILAVVNRVGKMVKSTDFAVGYCLKREASISSRMVAKRFEAANSLNFTDKRC